MLLTLTACNNDNPDLLIVNSDIDYNNLEKYDGLYKVTYSHVMGTGWAPFLEMEVVNSEIVSAKMDYVNYDGQLKSEDMDYQSEMKDKSGIKPEDAYNELELRLISSQNIRDVDIVSGASDTSRWYQEMVEAGFASGPNTSIVLPMNDSYTASEPDYNSHVWKAVIEIHYENDLIVKIDYDEFNKDGISKKDDADYQSAMIEESGTYPAEYTRAMEMQLLETQDPYNIDVISGATLSSIKFIDLAIEAIESRKVNPLVD